MEPRIQYTTTTDGVSIAWAEAGQGPAVLHCQPTPFSHVQENFVINAAAYGALARSVRLIMFDARGTGMSERDIADVSPATLLIDAEAVIDAAKLDRFVVIADMNLLALSTALHLATKLPKRVTHLVLESPYQNMRELADTPYGRTALALAEADWAVYVQTLIRVLSGWDAADSAWLDPIAKAVAGWVDPSVGLQYVREMETIDVGDLLAGVRQPTLVLRNDPTFIPARSCQRIAAKIPGAQFRQYSDPNYEQWAGLIREFVGLSSPLPPADAPVSSAFRTVLFTDLVGHTEMMQRLGDERGRDVLREHERITREVLKANGGTEVKTMGDGFMASFGSVTKAVECAVTLQRAFADHEGEPLSVRVGLNAGEPIEEDGDLFGATVILASRIAAKADGGEILVADTVRGLCSGKGFLFADRGEFVAKGFEEPVRVYEVSWRHANAS
jgi:class 3 adenylate cyclase/pimeloyl-ACP methyl ester carboxylesterase